LSEKKVSVRRTRFFQKSTLRDVEEENLYGVA